MGASFPPFFLWRGREARATPKLLNPLVGARHDADFSDKASHKPGLPLKSLRRSM